MGFKLNCFRPTNHFACDHSANVHFFKKPLCRNRSTGKKISTIAFHIFTLAIPLLVFKGISFCARKLSPAPAAQPISFSDGIRELFREQNIEDLPLIEKKDLPFEINDEPSLEELEQLAHSEFFKELPPVVRVRLNWFGKGVHEVILVKYTLFIPDEADNSEGSRSNEVMREGDLVWHDYLFITHLFDNEWRVFDPRHPSELPANFRKDHGHPEFPHPDLFPPISSESRSMFEMFELEKLFQNKPIGMFKYKVETPPFIAKNKDRNHFQNTYERVFEDIPIMLGHIEVDDFYPLFEINNYPDIVTDADGNSRLGRKPYQTERVIALKEPT